MTALFAKRVPGGTPPLQQTNPGAAVGQANSPLLPGPSYSPPQEQIYGTDPTLMRIAMQKQMFDQRQKQRAVAEALRRGWETAKRWHDERRGPVAPPRGAATMYNSATASAGPISANGLSSYGGQQMQSEAPQRGADGNQESLSQGWISATGPIGHKIVVHNGRWVDAQTGLPIR